MKKQLDEMEQSIKTRTQAFGFKLSVILLAVWTLYESYVSLSTGKRLFILPSLLLTSVFTATYVFELVLKRRMIRGETEYREPNKPLFFLVAALAVAAVIVSVGVFFLVKS